MTNRKMHTHTHNVGHRNWRNKIVVDAVLANERARNRVATGNVVDAKTAPQDFEGVMEGLMARLPENLGRISRKQEMEVNEIRETVKTAITNYKDEKERQQDARSGITSQDVDKKRGLIASALAQLYKIAGQKVSWDLTRQVKELTDKIDDFVTGKAR